MAVKSLRPAPDTQRSSPTTQHAALSTQQLFITYRLAEGVQVRQERFGLLFYNYRGPRLYFVPSGDLIADRFFDGVQTVGDLVECVHHEQGWPHRWIQDKITKIIAMLEAKGLIHGQSLC